ncbi:hypothetical protein MKX08_009996 [Trichoderma sp. CBMAI-0020]|nr:hypothetical protein MKX08_009996 [Trichoderma sp. CBMAI-0020]WOD46042.1 hypothetical protein [Trichoderma atroviride]
MRASSYWYVQSVHQYSTTYTPSSSATNCEMPSPAAAIIAPSFWRGGMVRAISANSPGNVQAQRASKGHSTFLNITVELSRRTHPLARVWGTS